MHIYPSYEKVLRVITDRLAVLLQLGHVGEKEFLSGLDKVMP